MVWDQIRLLVKSVTSPHVWNQSSHFTGQEATWTSKAGMLLVWHRPAPHPGGGSEQREVRGSLQQLGSWCISTKNYSAPSQPLAIFSNSQWMWLEVTPKRASCFILEVLYVLSLLVRGPKREKHHTPTYMKARAPRREQGCWHYLETKQRYCFLSTGPTWNYAFAVLWASPSPTVMYVFCVFGLWEAVTTSLLMHREYDHRKDTFGFLNYSDPASVTPVRLQCVLCI